jgi:hypothetical protein
MDFVPARFVQNVALKTKVEGLFNAIYDIDLA